MASEAPSKNKKDKVKPSKAPVKASKDGFDRSGLEDLLKRRFFYTPAFSIYGGVRGLYDYGPPGSAVKNNLLAYWRQHFILEENMLEIECTSVTPESVLKASGHVDKFTDLMVKDEITGECHRADHLLEDVIEKLLENKDLKDEERLELERIKASADDYSPEQLHEQLVKYNAKAPDTGNNISAPFAFNLMFPTPIGPSGKEQGYLRPETAQGMFVNFKRLLEFNAGKLPFAAAQIGPAFRNEISPRAGLLRVREFTLAEIEHFVVPNEKDHPKFDSVKDIVLTLYPRLAQKTDLKSIQMTVGDAVAQKVIDNQTLGYFLARCQLFLHRIGIKPSKLRFRQHMANEMAHYACDCWDAEIEMSYGWVECVGNADRSAYDLTVHSKASGDNLQAFVEFKEGPQPIDIITIVIDKAAVGKALKKDGQPVIKEVDRINDKLDFEAALKIANELDKNGHATIAGIVVKKDVLSYKKELKQAQGSNITPSVVEPSYGIGRILYAVFEHAYSLRPNTEQRAVLSFKPLVAPIKVAVLPLMSARTEFTAQIPKIVSLLTKNNISSKTDDSNATIGRRYARMDEIGVPFGVTIDHTTLEDQSVTLRERDSMSQVRIPVSALPEIVIGAIQEEITWADIQAKYPNVEPVAED